MTAEEAARALDRARDLQRRALSNHAKFLRAGSYGKSAREALDRYERQSAEADALFDGVAAWLENER